MTSVDIHKPQAAELDELRRIYMTSFPPEERRPWCDIIAPKRTDCPQLHAIHSNGQSVGLITLWRFEKFTYVEHFALAEEVRGHGIGGQVLDRLIKGEVHPIVVEVERGDSADAQRRIRFYEGHGFQLSAYDYIQPAYAPELPSVPLWLMCTQPLDATMVAQTLHREVYGVSAV
jgi:GNAT superfamily N-acetyltransferase